MGPFENSLWNPTVSCGVSRAMRRLLPGVWIVVSDAVWRPSKVPITFVGCRSLGNKKVVKTGNSEV